MNWVTLIIDIYVRWVKLTVIEGGFWFGGEIFFGSLYMIRLCHP